MTHDTSRQLAPRPAVLDDIADGAAEAVSVLRKVVTMHRMHPKHVPVWRAKIESAKALLHVSGYMAHANRAPAERSATLADMTADDLRRLVERTESELAERAKRVDARDGSPVELAPIDRAGAVDAELEPSDDAELEPSDDAELEPSDDAELEPSDDAELEPGDLEPGDLEPGELGDNSAPTGDNMPPKTVDILG